MAGLEFASGVTAEVLGKPSRGFFSVALGADADRPTLETIASSSDDFFIAAGREDLRAAYERIAIRVPCPPSTFWAGR